MQLGICTGFIDGALGITSATLRIVQVCIDSCCSQYDYCDPRSRAEYTLQISCECAGLFAYQVSAVVGWFRFLFKPAPAHFPHFI